MASPFRIALLTTLACTGLADAKSRLQATSDVPAQIAQASGEVVNHDGLAWHLTVPEGWSWRPAKKRDAPTLLIYSPGVSDETALEGVSEVPDSTVCNVTTEAKPDTVGKTQTELNEAARAHFEKTKDSVKGAADDHPLGPLMKSGGVEDKNGIAVMSGFQGIASDDKMIVLVGAANFSTPGFDHRTLCMVMLDVTKPDYVNAPVLTGVQALIASFQPL